MDPFDRELLKTFVRVLYRENFCRGEPMIQRTVSALQDATRRPNEVRPAIPIRRARPVGFRPPQGTDAFAQGWPQPRPAIPLSPGAAVLQEFDALYHKYQRRVFRQCYRMLGNDQDAEDATQEVFLQLFRKAHTFRGDASFSTWLHRMTINTVLMQIRRHRRWRGTTISLDAAPPGAEEGGSNVTLAVDGLPAPTTNPLDRIIVNVAMAQLSSGYQEIFVLYDMEGYRHDEIAELLGISEGTSKSQLHKARIRLRQLVGSAGGRTGSFRRSSVSRNIRRKRCPNSRVGDGVLV